MSHSRQLPPNASLRQLSNQAKDLLPGLPGRRTGRHPPDRTNLIRDSPARLTPKSLLPESSWRTPNS